MPIEEIEEENFALEIDSFLENVALLPRTDEEIEAAFQDSAFRVIHQTNNFFLPQLDDLIRRDEVVNLRPIYQRRLRWSAKKKSELIESLLLNIPIPPVYFYEGDFARYEVMDGQQRVNAIAEFMRNDLQLVGLDTLPYLNGRRYTRLPPKIKRSLDRASISAIVLLKETKGDDEDPYLVRRRVFEKLNTGGEKLNAQEIRNSIFKGNFNDLVVELSKSPSFCRLFGIPEYGAIDDADDYENPERIKNTLYRTMGDCQLVLRFFALQSDDHITGAMTSILDRCMKRNMGASLAEIVSFRQIFTASLDACEEIFGIEAFRLPASTTGYRKLSFALFDAVAVAVSRRIWLVPTLLTRKAAVQTGLDQLIHQRPDLFTGKSNTSISVRERISVVEGLFDSLS